MRYGPVDLDQAAGAILGHNVVDGEGRRVLRKGKALEARDLEVLRKLGRESVYAARLDPEDVSEDVAADRVTRAVVGAGLRLSGPSTGRVNVHSRVLGLVKVDVARLGRLNSSAGVTLATRRDGTPVTAGKMVATTKILPYAVPDSIVVEIEQEAASHGPILWLRNFESRRVGLIVTSVPGSRDKIVGGFETALRRRVEALGSRLERTDFVALESETGGALESLASALDAQASDGIELVLLAGETAIQDRNDLAPSAVELAGGVVECFGAPVDPGNLLMLGHLGEVAVVGAPGCARSSKPSIVDLVLPRLLVGERLDASDVTALGHGGLLDDVPERPLPRSRI